MRILLAATLVAGLTWQPQVVMAQPAAPAPTPAAAQFDMRPIVVGLGAIVGVAAFNVLALGVEAVPGGLAYGAGATVPAEMSVAMSRVYATTSAVVGAWIAYYGYGQ
jgi:hypothetical protein